MIYCCIHLITFYKTQILVATWIENSLGWRYFLFTKILLAKFYLVADYVHNTRRYKYTIVHIYINLELLTLKVSYCEGRLL